MSHKKLCLMIAMVPAVIKLPTTGPKLYTLCYGKSDQCDQSPPAMKSQGHSEKEEHRFNFTKIGAGFIYGVANSFLLLVSQ